MIVILTNTAKDDLENIYQFYNAINPFFAAKTYNNILEAMELLEIFPLIAPLEPLLTDKSQEYRSLTTLKGRIKIIYFITNELIYITSIWNCRQNPTKLMGSI